MYVFDLIDECENMLSSVSANASIIEPEELIIKIEKACHILNRIRKNITTFDCSPSDVRGL